jgi:PKD repeat protein
VPGTGGNNRRTITASYSGDASYSARTATAPHRVNPLPTVNSPPTAAFTPPTCAATQPCQFTDASTDSDGSVASWSWTFGDGQTSTDKNPLHTYATSGSYTVTLTATDDKGASNPVTHTVTTNPFARPDTYTTQGTTPLTTGFADGVLSNDVGGALIAAGFLNGSGPTHGTVTRWDVNGSFDYTPNGDGATSDTFKYIVTDEFGTGNETTVTINITP